MRDDLGKLIAEQLETKEGAKKIADARLWLIREVLTPRLKNLNAENILLEKRLDYLLSRCFVNRFGEIALPTGCMVISREEKEASIALIDRAIEVREKGL